MSAVSRHEAPELCEKTFGPSKMRAQATLTRAQATPRRAQETPGAQCTRSLAWSVENTRVSHHRLTGTPGISCAMVLTVSFVLSSVTGLCCHRRPWKLASHELDASVGASGPHDFAVRLTRCSSKAPLRPPHPHPTSVTIAKRPSSGWDNRLMMMICAQKKAKNFARGDWTGFC